MYESTPSLAGSLRREVAPITDPWVALLDDATYEARRTVREQTKWEHSINVESATWIGLLIDLAENENRVTLLLESGQIVSGRITKVGADFVGVAATKEFIAISHSTIIGIESETKIGQPDSDRTGSAETFHSLLRDATESRLDVALTMRGTNDELFGQLRTCGTDVCGLVSTERPQRYVYLPTSAIIVIRMTSR